MQNYQIKNKIFKTKTSPWLVVVTAIILFLGSIVFSSSALAVESTFTTSLTTTGLSTLPPSIPTNLSATAVSDTQIDLSWTASVPNYYAIGGYRIFRDSIFLATTTSTIYSDTSLTPVTPYSYTVEAFDTLLQMSGRSATSTATTTATPIPTPPPGGGGGGGGSGTTGIIISNIRIVPGTNQAQISFTTNVPTQSKVQWGFSQDFELGSLQNLFYGYEHTQIITGLTEGLTYQAKLSANNSTGASVSTNVSFTTILPITEVGPLPNPSDFVATATDKDINLSWVNPEDPRFNDVRIVRTEGFYPIDEYDGVPIYEGDGESFVDTTAKKGVTYYYAIFSRSLDGEYSSGALAQARIAIPGEEPVTAVVDPFANLPQAKDVHPMIKALTLADFEFIQDGRNLATVVGNTVAIHGGKNLTVRLKYDKVPEILKTVAFTLEDPTDKSKVFPFLLRVNKDKTYYEATIGALGRSGRYGMSVAILDYENNGLMRLNGTLAALAFASPLFDFGKNFDFLGLLILLLFIILIILAIMLLKRWVYYSPEHETEKRPAYSTQTGSTSNARRIIVGLFTLVFAQLFIFGISSTAHAAFNPEINYQGKLVTSTNSIVPDGSYNIRFKLYTTLSGGSPIWTETWCNTSDCAGTGVGTDDRIDITNGLFSTMLGSTTAFTGVDFNQPLYLGVEIGGSGATAVWDGEMSPRKILGAVPAAFVAENANTLGGLNSSQFFRTDAQNATSSATTFLNVIQTGAGKIAEFFGSASQSVLALLSNGNVGIGTTTPSAKLSIQANNGETNTTLFNIASSTAYATTSLFTVLNNGNVGIGTSTPNSKLALAGGNFTHTASGVPTIVGTYNINVGYDVYVSGKHAYVADSTSGLQILDISNPASPTLTGTYNTSGTAYGVYVSGKYAYVADGTSGLQIIDISNPASPTLTGTYNTSGNAYGVYVSGKYAYVADDTSGLHIINISNPSSPTLVGTYNTSGNAFGIYVSGKYAYVGDNASGLQIIDISNPASPTLVGTYNTSGTAYGVYVSGKYAYVADDTSGLHIINISNPSSPTLVGTYNTIGNAYRVYVSGKYAYVADLEYGLYIINISSPVNPVLVSQGLAEIFGIFVSGKYAYATSIITSQNKLYVIDINGIETPSLYAGNIATNGLTVTENADIGNSLYVRNSLNVGLGGIFTDGVLSVAGTSSSYFGGNLGIGTTSPFAKLSVAGIGSFDDYVRASYFTATSTTATSTFGGVLSVGSTTPAGNALFSVGTSTQNLFVDKRSGNVGIGTSTPNSKLALSGGNFTHAASGNPTLAGTYDTVDYTLGVDISGKYAYIAENTAGLRIVDISNPASSALVGTYDTSGNARDVYVSGKYAYVADGSSGLQIVDISNPSSPTLIGTYDTSDYAYEVYVSGKYAYAADSASGLQIVDISNPASPTLTGTYDTSGYALGVYVYGKYAYVADYTSGLQIVDISNPASPALVGTYDTSGNARDVYVSGKYAYVADESAGLQIINISNPSSPSFVGAYNTSGNSRGVYVSGKYAYVADESAGLQIINISNPASSALVGTYDTSGFAMETIISGKYAYVADYDSGLQIIDINGIETPSLYAGNIATNGLTVTENADFGNNLFVRNGLNVGGGGIFTDGPLSVGGTTSPSYFAGNVGIGTTSPYTKLSVAGIGSFDDYVRGSYFTATSTTATSTFPNLSLTNLLFGSDYLTDITGTGLAISNGALSVTGAAILGAANMLAGFDSSGNLTSTSSPQVAFINATSTTATSTFAGGISVASSTFNILNYNGYVGIGTSTPNSKLALSGGNFTHTAVGNPTLAGTYNTADFALGVYVSSKYTYVADGGTGLLIFDTSNPNSPTLVGTYDTSSAYDVYVSGKYAYVADNGAGPGLYIIDISNPSSPTLAGTYDTSGSGYGVYVSGKYAYIADFNSGLQIIDISNPSSPTLAGTYNTIGSAIGVYVSDKYAYVADYDSGLQIIDISNPTSPTLTGTYDTTSFSRDVYVSGKYAYVADGSGGLLIIDISNPSSPTLVGTYDTSGVSYEVYVSGKYAYVADDSSGLQVINISNPASPSLVGTYNTSGGSNGVYVSGKYAYVADGLSGLQIIDINGIETPSLYAGNIATNNITVTENGDFGNNLFVRNGLNVGFGGIFTDGVLSVAGTSTSYFGGNVGVGTTSPFAKLSVVGQVVGEYFTATSTTATSTFSGGFKTGGSTGLTVYSTGNVGIGSAPIAGVPLFVYGGNILARNEVAPTFALSNDNNTSNLSTNATVGNVEFAGRINGSSDLEIARIRGIYTGDGTTRLGDLTFMTSNGGGPGEKMRITSSGNVGIGTTSPFTKLSVAGIGSFDDYVRASYFTATSTTATSTFGGVLSVGSTTPAGNALFSVGTSTQNLFVDKRSGNVGIGTSTPNSKLALSGGNFTHTASGNPTLAGTYNTTGTSFKSYISGKYAYVADGTSGLQIIDVSNPSSPTLTGTFSDSSYVFDMNVSGNYAYTVGGHSSIGIVNISNPKTPILLGYYRVDPLEQLISIYVSGKYAYVVGLYSIYIVDISNVTNPKLVGTSPLAEFAYGVYVSGKYAYVAENYSGLRIIDISNPNSPVYVGNYNTSGIAYEVYVSGKYAYVADGTSGLHIIDISNPSSPTLVGTYNTTGEAWGVNVSGKYAYVADGASGLHVIDISNPASPSLVGTYNTSGEATGVYLSGKYAHIADGSSGLQIVDINGIETPSLYAGNIATNGLTVTEDADFGNNLFVRNGLNVGGGGIFTDGPLSVGGTTSPSYFAGKVGIGTTSPYSKLSVWGSGTGTNRLFELTNSASTTLASFLENGTGYFLGNIGIGTTSPYAKLSVVGQTVSEYFTATSTTATSTFPNLTLTNLLFGSDYLTDITGSGLAISNGALSVTGASILGAANMLAGFDASGNLTSTSSPQVAYINATSTTATSTFAGNVLVGGNIRFNGTLYKNNNIPFVESQWTNYASSIFYTDNVSVGTTSFRAKLTVDNTVQSAGDGTIFSVSGVSAMGTLSPNGATGDKITMTAGNGGISWGGIGGTGGSIYLNPGAGGFSDTIGQDGSIVLANLRGNVGIGTTSPFAKLSVTGTGSFDDYVRASYFTSTSTTATSTFAGGMNVAGTSGLTVLQNGNVGMGTVSPTVKLQIVGNEIVHNALGTGNAIFHGLPGTAGSWVFQNGRQNSDIVFNQNVAGVVGTRVLTLRGSNGNVGIGTSSPYTKLSVVGQTVSEYFTATSTTASTFPYASTTALTISGTDGLQLASGLNGLLQAVNGLVQSSSTLSIAYGGTGLSTAPAYGQLLVGNALGGYTLTSTSSLGISAGTGWDALSDISLTKGYFVVGDDAGVAQATSSLFVSSTGSLGIGTINPGSKLEVVGDIISKGTSWTEISVPGNWNDVAYGNGMFVAIGVPIATNKVMTSPDGINWTGRSVLGNNDSWQSITYGNGLFVAVSASGDRIMTSPDGINWTARSVAGNNDSWFGVTYGNGLFVAVGSSLNDNVATSPDGINWTIRSAAGNDDTWYDVTYGNGLFVAVGSGGGDVVMTSPDGINWTAISAAGNDDLWSDVTYGNGLFVAVGYELDNSYGVMTSPDGANWTIRNTGTDYTISAVTYGNGLFVGAPDNGAVITSPDGLNWTRRDFSNNDDSWYGAVYGNGKFVMVGVDVVGVSGKTEETVLVHNNIYQGGMNIFGNVGVGTTSPYSKLSVWGSGTGTSGLFEITNSASTTLVSFLENGTGYFQGNLGIGTTSPYAKLSVVGQVVGAYFTATTTTASTFPYASTTALTVSGTNGLQLASGLNGPLQAVNGLVSSTSTLSIGYGGTGTSSAPTYGQLLMGDGNGNYSFAATSTLGILASSAIGMGTQGFVPYYAASEQALTATSSLFISQSSFVGIGTTTPTSALSVFSASSPQFQLAYNKDNYVTTGVSSSGGVTMAVNGTAGGFAITNPQPTAVVSGTGTNAPLGFSATGGIGGNSLDTNIGVGGIGGGIQLNAGVGGTAVLSTFSETGGAGGTVSVNGGAGANASSPDIDFMSRVGGNGGAFSLTSGAGGNATNGGLASSNTAGAGGAFVLRGGAGGNASGATTNNGGAGGSIYFAGGAGGTGSTANGTAGNLYLGYDGSSAIGNVYFGNQSASYIGSSGNFGIGTTSPYAKLSVAGDSLGTTPLFAVSTSTASATSTAFIVDSQGRVGIGSSTPMGIFGIQTSSSANKGFYFNSSNQFVAPVGGTATLPTLAFISDSSMSGLSSANGAGLDLSLNGGNVLQFARPSGSNARIANRNATGDIQIWSGNEATGAGQLYIGSSGVKSYFNTDSTFTIGSTTPYAKLAVYGNAGETNSMLFAVASSTDSATTTHFVVKNDGKVGIGTSNPSYKLQIASGSIYQNGIADSNYFDGHIFFGGTAPTYQSVLRSDGKIGLGTTTPYAKLSVVGQVVGAYFTATTTATSTFAGGVQANALNITSATATSTFANGIKLSGGCFQLPDGSCAGTGAGGWNSLGDIALADGYFVVGNPSGVAQATSSLFVSQTGNIGIGTTSPYAKLSVAGSAGQTTDLFAISSSTASFATTTAFKVASDGTVSAHTILPWGNMKQDLGSAANKYSYVYSSVFSGIGNTLLITTGGGDSIKFCANNCSGTNQMYLVSGSSGGGLSIGTTTATNYAKLMVRGNGATSASQTVEIYNTASTTLLRILDDGTTYFGGNVGIGTTSPYAKLSVVGEAVARNFTATSTTATSTFAGGLDVGSGNLVYDLDSGVTSINSLITGNMNFEEDAGAVSWVDLPVTNAPSGTVESYTAQLGGRGVLSVYGLTDATGRLATTSITVSIGTSTPYTSGLTIWGPDTLASTRALDVLNSASSSLLTVYDDGAVKIGGTTSTTTINGYLDVIGTGTNSTSTISSNLWVKGTLRSNFSYVGDLIFANNFAFTEALPINSTTTQALYLNNQKGERVLAIDDMGNLKITGDICSDNVTCVNESLNKLSSDLDALASSTAVIQAGITGLSDGIAQTTTSSVQSLADAIVALDLKVDALVASSTIDVNFLIASTSMALASSTEFIASVSTSTATVLNSDTSFITSIANAVKNILSSAQDWAVDKFTAKVAYVNRVEAETVAISKGMEIVDQASGAVWCVTIKNGDWNKVMGTCASLASTTPVVAPTPIPVVNPTPIVIPATTVSTGPEIASTTTSAIPSTTATSTATSTVPLTGGSVGSTGTGISPSPETSPSSSPAASPVPEISPESSPAVASESSPATSVAPEPASSPVIEPAPVVESVPAPTEAPVETTP